MNYKISRRYSLALYDEAGNQGILDGVERDALTIIDAIKNSRELEVFFLSPVIEKDKKSAIVKEIFSGKVNPLTLNLMLLMVSRKRENITLDVFTDFLTLKDSKDGIVRAEVTTAIELNEDERKKVNESIEQYSNFKSIPEFKVDDSILGGFVVKINDTILDASIKRQLELLRAKFKHDDLSLN